MAIIRMSGQLADDISRWADSREDNLSQQRMNDIAPLKYTSANCFDNAHGPAAFMNVVDHASLDY